LINPLLTKVDLYMIAMSTSRLKCTHIMRFSKKLSNLELWSLLMTNRKSYMGFSKNTLLESYDDLEQQQTSPHTPQYTETWFCEKVSNLV